jgi:hypothetical protein
MTGARLPIAILVVLVVALAVWLAVGRDDRGRVAAPSRPLVQGLEVAPVARAGDGTGSRVDARAESLGTDPAAADVVRTGSVSFLDVASREPVRKERWIFEGDSGIAISCTSDANGSCQVPIGAWRVGHGAGELECPPDVVDVDGSGVLVWVSRSKALRVHVVDDRGRGVAGALVAWMTRRGDGSMEEGAVGTTDELGDVSLDDLGSSVGCVRVVADDYRIARVPVYGAESVVVRLEPGDGVVRLQFVDALTGSPVEGVRIAERSGGRGRLPGVSRPDGLIELRGWRVQRVEAEREGYCRSWIHLAEREGIERRVPLPPATSWTVRVEDDAGRRQSFALWVRSIEPTVAGDVTVVTPQGERGDATNGATFRLPQDRKVRVTAVADSGLVVDADIMLTGEALESVLGARARPTLDIEVVDARGSRLTEIRADVRFFRAGERQVVVADARGILRVPAPGDVTGIDLFALGRAATTLEPIESFSGERSGHLRVQLSNAADVRLRAIDEDGEPIPALTLRVHNKDRTWSAFRENPKLSGNVATDHPGWARQPTPSWTEVTTGDGSIRLSGMPTGQYTVSADLPSSTDPVRVALYPLTEHVVDVVETTREVELVLPRASLARVEATDAATGEPVATLSLAADEHSGMRGTTTDGSVWEGWIASNLGPLTLTSPGYRSTRLHSADLLEQRVFAVRLWPGNAARLELVGDVDALEGQILLVRALREWKDDDGTPIGKPVAWTGEATIVGGAVALVFPFEEVELELVPLSTPEGTWTFEPERTRWTNGASIVLRASLRPR